MKNVRSHILGRLTRCDPKTNVAVNGGPMITVPRRKIRREVRLPAPRVDRNYSRVRIGDAWNFL